MQPGTVPQIFMNTVNKYGDRVALRYKKFGLWHNISWNEYYNYVKYIALALVSMGFEKGDRVAIIGDNCPEWVMIDMAVLCAGGTTVGIYATNSRDQCEYVINHAEAKFFFIHNEEQLDKWLQFKGNSSFIEKVIAWDLKGLRDFKDPMFMTLNELIEQGRNEDKQIPGLMKQLMADISPDDNALFIYTSGTTGPPKGAVLTHKNAAWIGYSLPRANNINNKEEILSFLPLCHIFEHMMTVFVHIAQGYTVNFIESPDTIFDNMKEVSPTLGYAVPRIWEKYHSFIMIRMSDASLLKKALFNYAMKIGRKYIDLKQTGKADSQAVKLLYCLAYYIVFRKLKERLGFDRMRMAYSGAAPISPEVLTFFNIIGIKLLEGYGQTEATGVTTLNRIGKSVIGTVGSPISGVKLRIAENGEILIKSPGVFKGYHKDPQTTESTLIDGWLHSGDSGEIDIYGNLKITGRLKDIIITAGGKNITPQYIEGKLVFSPYINDAIVIGDGKKYLTSLIVLDEDNTVKFAQDNKIQFSYYSDLTRHPEINKLIQSQVDKANEKLSKVEQIKKFAILPHKLYEEEGDVTPTMKVKRKTINERYKDIIESLYK